MNVIEQARQAYAPKYFPLRTPRSIEAELISQITAKLKKTSADHKKNFPEFVAALSDNRKLWTTMAADVADNLNSLPSPLRAQIFYLAGFTEHHSAKILKGEADSEVLIEINTAILRGLNKVGTS
ncbi:flagellar biosynthesis regulator FlaF [Yoonia sp. MH D7]